MIIFYTKLAIFYLKNSYYLLVNFKIITRILDFKVIIFYEYVSQILNQYPTTFLLVKKCQNHKVLHLIFMKLD